ncbi:hypothetical protein L2E82_13931 [Cichorium intybus]|uniref:Uncharacterized protein n=1 Tax=Cichorium intybus TaxID=13427 RepID=A0ACB9EZ74_CICIN|nr:hypothetical protein L2E82_13931 [Cichorium intybus]
MRCLWLFTICKPFVHSFIHHKYHSFNSFHSNLRAYTACFLLLPCSSSFDIFLVLPGAKFRGVKNTNLLLLISD